MRRSRFTAHTNHGPKVILAYEAESVRSYYERQGYAVNRVERGDYRQKARDAAIKAQGGFRVDPAALKAACEALGLKLPVRIKMNGRVGQTNGNYRFKGDHHAIMLKSYRTAAQASATLWHELQHALQAERSGGTTETWAEVRRANARYAYSRRPIEVEARQMSDRMADRPLCFPN